MIAPVRFITVFVLMAVVGAYLAFHADVTVPMNKSLAQFPEDIKGWRMVSESFMTEDVQRVLKASDYLFRQYKGPGGEVVSLYIGYHSGGKNSGAIHSPKHCLPGAGWSEVKSGEKVLEAEGQRINVAKAVYQKGGDKELFLYWFQVRQKTIASEYFLKLEEILGSAFHGRRDSSFIRISVRFDTDEERAHVAGEAFIKAVYPAISQYLPK